MATVVGFWEILALLQKGVKVLQFVKSVLNLFDSKPNYMEEFNKLHDDIASVRNDIKELMHDIKWQGAEIQYAGICNIIAQGMEECKFINKYRKENDEHNQKL